LAVERFFPPQQTASQFREVQKVCFVVIEVSLATLAQGRAPEASLIIKPLNETKEQENVHFKKIVCRSRARLRGPVVSGRFSPDG